MKAAYILLLATAALAQSAPSTSAAPPGCGPIEDHFKVKTSDPRPAVQPDPEKAVVYFIQDDSEFVLRPRPSTRMGVDGNWVGATNANSYFYVLLAPGEHHLCASWQSSESFTSENAAAAHFVAKPGGVYFFRERDFSARDFGSTHVDLLPLDSDEGQLLIATFSFSTSTPRKSP